MSAGPIMTPEQAKELVEQIAEEHGWIPPEDRAQSTERTLQAIDKYQRMLGASARKLATHLYQSQARFIFELVQNAEDNSYTRALASEHDPFLKFTISPSTIVVDCNEDGFTRENVEAICNVGASTKTRNNAQYYIGEKGIGFKSVFMVASEVHIQSGHFSFSFKHHPGDSGMGMITPEYREPEEGIDTPLTRMTLTVINNQDHPKLTRQVQDLPDSLLLFLRKLKCITITVGAVPDTQVITYTCQSDEISRRATLSKLVSTESNRTMVEVKHYHITKRHLQDLPDDEHRDYNTAEIILAFPVSGVGDEAVPVIEPQHVYAYLPIRDFGFAFLIQSDFITQASRQDIMECPRNHAILDGIADAFRDAVLQFCEHPKLQYLWMRFLPRFSFDPFWGTILIKIKNALRSTPVLRPRNHGPLRLISQLRVLPNDFKIDGNSPEPLLTDSSDDEIFLAPEYAEQDIAALKTLGLRSLTEQDVISVVKSDLNASSSRIRSVDRTDEWHSRLSKFLLTSFKGKCIPYLMTMPVIPLSDGQWISASLCPVYFPESHGIPIPADLGLQLVDPKSIKGTGPWEKKLFIALGVKDAVPSHIRQSIIAQYEKPHAFSNTSLQHSVAHLRYLYFTHENDPITQFHKITTQVTFKNHGSGGLPFGANPRPVISFPSFVSDCEGTANLQFEPHIENQLLRSTNTQSDPEMKDCFQTICCLAKYKQFSPEEIRLTDYARGYRQHRKVPYHWLWLFDHKNRRVSCQSDIYFRSDEEFGVKELLKGTYLEPSIAHLNAAYTPPAPNAGLFGQSSQSKWDRWLEGCVGIQHYPPIADYTNPQKMSSIFHCLSQERPEKFLGALRAQWEIYGSDMNAELVKVISSVRVPCANGTRTTLSESYLPILESFSKPFLKHEKFPFLELHPKADDQTWSFLEMFGVRSSDDIDFYLALLESIVVGNPIAGDIPMPDRVLTLYEKIQLKYWDSEEKPKEQEKIRQFFKSHAAILSSDELQKATWAYPSDCLWEGPIYWRSKTPLANFEEYKDKTILADFLQRTLEVPNLSLTHITDEFSKLKELDYQGKMDLTNIQKLYKKIDELCLAADASARMQTRQNFRHQNLIFVAPGQWRSAIDCIWATTSQIEGKFAIANQYVAMDEFFVGFIGVTVPYLGMFVDEMKNLIESGPGLVLGFERRVRNLILHINTLQPTAESLQPLWELAIFPVKLHDGRVKLQPRSFDFAIVDRQNLADAFDGRARLLDFSLEEVWKLEPFLSCFDLEDRYLSRMVEERSSIKEGSSDPHSVLTRNLRRKAYALFRCAYHFRSPRTADEDQSLYQLLLAAVVYPTERIISKLIIKQDGQTISVNAQKYKLHIEETSSVLRIYVPKNSKARELCYLRLLPSRMFHQVFMQRKRSTVSSESDIREIGIIADVLKSSDAAVEDVLEHAGIVGVPFQDEFVEPFHELESEPKTSRHGRPTDSSSHRLSGNRTLETRVPSAERNRVPELGQTASGPSSSPGETPAFAVRLKAKESPSQS